MPECPIYGSITENWHNSCVDKEIKGDFKMSKLSILAAGAMALAGLTTGCKSTNVSAVGAHVDSRIDANLTADIEIGQNIDY